jgi:hypothetical protein
MGAHIIYYKEFEFTVNNEYYCKNNEPTAIDGEELTDFLERCIDNGFNKHIRISIKVEEVPY